jgi:hypothetical protein
MADTLPIGDLAGAVSDALRGDRTRLRAMVSDARQRTEDRTLGTTTPLAQPSPVVVPPAARPRSMPRPRPDREVEIRLQNGRRMRATIAPAIARRSDLSALARTFAGNDRRAFAALHRHRAAIARLTEAQRELADKVAALQSQADESLIGLAQGIGGLERQLRDATTQAQVAIASTAATSAFPVAQPGGRSPLRPLRKGELRRLQARQRTWQLRQIREAKAVAARAQIQSVTSVINSVQATAYGDKGSLFSTNNLMLAGNQLFWALLDPVLQRFGVLDATSATVMAALAPVGTLLTGQVLLGDRQTARFISGVAVLDGDHTVVFQSLRGQVGEHDWPEFRDRTDVPVTINVLTPSLKFARFRADVADGVVRIGYPPGFESPFPAAQVAWMVDTGIGSG